MVLREQLHEWSMPQVHPTSLWFDSQSTVFAVSNEGSVKRSVWSLRRAVVIQEAIIMRVIKARKLSTARNLADIFTKYVKYVTWRRMIDEVMNITTDSRLTFAAWR